MAMSKSTKMPDRKVFVKPSIGEKGENQTKPVEVVKANSGDMSKSSLRPRDINYLSWSMLGE